MQVLKPLSTARSDKRSKRRNAPPKNYFSQNTTILRFCGVYPIASGHRTFVKISFWLYFCFVYIIIVTINTITKGMALPYEKNLDDLTDNISFLTSHVLAVYKIGLFVYRRNDVIRLTNEIEGPLFRHNECENFSSNGLIRGAIDTTRRLYYGFSFFSNFTILNGAISAMFERSDEGAQKFYGNDTTAVTVPHRVLPYHAWFPFSTQTSPNYELIFIYQVLAIVHTSQIIMSMDTMIVGFMVHIKVQLQILGHNLRFMREHAMGSRMASTSSEDPGNFQVDKIMDAYLKKNIIHHQAIIRKD